MARCTDGVPLWERALQALPISQGTWFEWYSGRRLVFFLLVAGSLLDYFFFGIVVPGVLCFLRDELIDIVSDVIRYYLG
jgi:hypothetical protein